MLSAFAFTTRALPLPLGVLLLGCGAATGSASGGSETSGDTADSVSSSSPPESSTTTPESSTTSGPTSADGSSGGQLGECAGLPLQVEPFGDAESRPPAGVRAGFVVTDCLGRGVPCLSPDHVTLINDDTGRPFDASSEGETAPALGVAANIDHHTLLLLDFSDSIFAANAQTDVTDAAKALVDRLVRNAAPGARHAMSIIAFGSPASTEVVLSYSSVPEQLDAAIDALADTPRGTTDLYGAYMLGVGNAGAQSPADETLLVLVTDGLHEAGNEETLRGNALAAREGSAETICTVGVAGDYDEALLEELAKGPAVGDSETCYVPAANFAALQSAFDVLADESVQLARSHYRVGVCTPISGGSSITIRVEVDGSYGEVSIPYTASGNLSACDPIDVLDAPTVSQICDGTTECVPWSRRFGASLFSNTVDDGAYAGASDAAGNLHLAGIVVPTSEDLGDLLTAKLDPYGDIIYTHQSNADYEFATTVSVTEDDRVLIGGWGRSNFLDGGGPNGAFTAEIDALGVPVDGSFLGFGTNRFVSGGLGLGGARILAGTGMPPFPGAPPNDNWFVAEVSDTGELVWGAAFGGADRDELGGMAIHPDTGEIILAGLWAESPIDERLGVMSLSATGTLQWSQTYGHVVPEEFGAMLSGVALDPDSGIYAAGWVGAEVQNVPGYVQGEDVVVLAFDFDGTLRWAQTLGSTEDERATAITVTQAGEVIVSGLTAGDLAQAQDPTGSDAFLAAYDLDGGLLRVSQFSMSNACPTGLTADRPVGALVEMPDGGVALIGRTRDSDPGQEMSYCQVLVRKVCP